jgi:D-glycero-alpha-D-manno-heptose-7-phosphate kinase
VLEGGDLAGFAELLTQQWECKRRRTANVTSAEIDRYFGLGLENGALGGKLVGAGGGGFLMFYAGDKPRLRHTMLAAGMREVRFRFDFEGTKVVVQS